MTFDEWLAALDVIAETDGMRCGGGTYTQMTGCDCWRDAFVEGDTPQQAFDADMLAGL